MRNVQIGLAMLMLWGWSVPEARGRSLDSAALRTLSLEAIANTYPTPKALARFLHEAITFKTDEELFGIADYWQAPEDVLARRAGDCEDYALLAQAVLARRGITAYVLSVYGTDGYAHTVCAFLEAGRYNVINQDRLQSYQAPSLEVLAKSLYPGWTYSAIAHRTGTRGIATRLIYNPNPTPQPSTSESFFSFP